MKILVEITEEEIEFLKQLKNYFGEHDKIMFEHRAYPMIDGLVKKLNKPDVMDCSTCKHINVSKYVEPCYGCRDGEDYDHYESAIVP